MNIQKRLKILKPLLTFEENEFIFVQILVRRKDNPDLDLSVKRLKSYCFYSWEELEKNSPRIQEICDLNNARAYIRLNKQNSVDVSFRCIETISKNLRDGCPDKNRNVWDSLSGQGGEKSYWILDLDTEHLDLLNSISSDINLHFANRCPKEFEFFSTILNPTKSGVHLITKPFDTRILDKYNKKLSAEQLPTIQIAKDANTILYIGNSTND